MSTPTAKQIAQATEFFAHFGTRRDLTNGDIDFLIRDFAQALAAATPRWIPVSEPPKNSHVVMVWLAGRFNRFSRAYWDDGEWNVVEDFVCPDAVVITALTHWQPLPPPPAIEGEP